MQTKEMRPRFFRSVEPLAGYKLRVSTLPGEEILFDFVPRMGTTRFADLKNPQLFGSAATDGECIYFQIPGFMPVRISAGEFFTLLAKTPVTASPVERWA
jgi:hypothetical protein